jgi:tRNA(His) guanylyltransferase
MEKMTLGQRMKAYEKQETDRTFLPLLPIYARIDGRSFHSFARGMDKPYDKKLMWAMVETMKYLVEKTHACIGYTQSDEISLIFYTDRYDSQIFFDRSVFKMTSNIASLATAKFLMCALEAFPDRVKKSLPTFDCRVVQFPTKEECVNMLRWRVRDAVKNSISMLASCYFSDKELHGKNSAERLNMLHHAGIKWNEYPSCFKQGTFAQRKTFMVVLTPEELEKIPAKHRPDGPVVRTRTIAMEAPPFDTIVNPIDFVYWQIPPMTRDDKELIVNQCVDLKI